MQHIIDDAYFLFLSQKYSMSPVTIGILWGTTYSLITGIHFELFLKKLCSASSKEEYDFLLEQFFNQNLKKLQEKVSK